MMHAMQLLRVLTSAVTTDPLPFNKSFAAGGDNVHSYWANRNDFSDTESTDFAGFVSGYHPAQRR